MQCALPEEPMPGEQLSDFSCHDLGDIEEAFNSDAARQLFSEPVTEQFDLADLLAEDRNDQAPSDGQLNERRVRMRRHLAAAGEPSPQRQFLHLRVKEPSRCTRGPERPGPSQRRSIAVSNPLLASLLESPGPRSPASPCAAGLAPPASFAAEQQYPTLTTTRVAGTAGQHVKQERLEPDGLLDTDGADLAGFMHSNGGAMVPDMT
ncbi:uncharacterized protein LOC119091498 [Pollicipes pollicipes]|uniref:uncharacterized protein LOC119091498 n=1 Tax=Pollicipes pollicipes TaxID=41117 RepID=UPI0018857881|nr:uncharacterized protein LOC119091498 [Pollicipes pollicipes]